MFRRGYEIKGVPSDPDDDDKDQKTDAFPVKPTNPLVKPKAPPVPLDPVTKKPTVFPDPNAPKPTPPPKPPPRPSDTTDPKETKALKKKLADLRLDFLMLQAVIWGRLFGGSLLILGANDGQTPDKPLNEDNIIDFKFLNCVDRRYVWAQQYYNDPMSPRYGLPELYLITNMISGAGLGFNGGNAGRTATTVIHESRVIRFDGNETDDLTRQQLAGWTFSVLQRVYDTLRKFEHSFDSVGALMSDASQAVFKMQGLIEAIATGNKNDINTRLAWTDMSRSTIKAVVLDAGDADGKGAESFNREPTSFSGLAELLKVWMLRLCAAADMPATEVFGQAAQGLDATGDNEVRKWYDMIASDQETKIKPGLQRVINLISKAGDSPITDKDTEWEVTFNPLWMPTDKEQADFEYEIAQRDQIYIQEGVLTPEQVALGAFGGNKFSSWREVDKDALQEAIDGKQMNDPYENEAEDPALVVAPQTGEAASPLSPLPITQGPNPKASSAGPKKGK
jgi:phage-related protein (TIGR01555 family)